MTPSNRTFLIAVIGSTLFIGGVAFGIHKLFNMNLSTWTSPWAWGPLLFFWLACTGVFIEKLVPLEVLRYFDREAVKH